MEVHEDDCSAFLLVDVLLEVEVPELVVPLEVVLVVEVLVWWCCLLFYHDRSRL